MAKIELLAPKILQWEGGFVNDPLDNGGATNMGVTVATWQKVGYDKNHDGHIDDADIKLLTPDDFKFVLIKYWNTWKADQILNQSIANILVDWVWGSGKWGIIIPQRLLGVTPDGIVGEMTLTVLNANSKQCFFNDLYQARINFLNNIVKENPDQRIFFNGWMNRLESFTFCPSNE